jgi:hypothetical protein
MSTGFLVGLVFITVGGIVFLLAIRDYRTATASAAWPSTEGTITELGVRAERDEDDVSYAPEVAYTYAVVGSPYRGTRIVVGATRRYTSRSRAEAALRGFAMGQNVTVYYDPERPDEAVLQAGVKRGAYGTFFIAAVFVAFGVIAMLFEVLGS